MKLRIIKEGLKGYNPDIECWDKPTVRMFNGARVEGRPTRGYGTASFNYAGKLYDPTPWTDSIQVVKKETELLIYKELRTRVEFNFCLCGLYKTGKVGIPHHSDTVPTLEDLVVGVSFGATRILEWNQYSYSIKKETNTSEIDINHKENHLETTRYFLEDGDVYVFDGFSQMTSTHAIPTTENTKERINLTFRTGLGK